MRAIRLAVVAAVVGLSTAAPARAAPIVTPVVTDTQLLGSFGITTSGTSLFVTTGASFTPQGRVYSVPLGGGPLTLLHAYAGTPPQGSGSPLGITALGTNLFWIDPNSGPFTDPQVLRGAAGGGGGVTAIHTGSAAGSPYGSLDGSDITNDGTRLFWADEVGGGIYQINPDGSGLGQLGADRYTSGFANEHLNTIAQSNGVLYVADSGRAGAISPQVVSIPTTGGAYTTLFAGAPFVKPTGIAVGNNTVYVADGGAGAIWSLPLTGGTPTQLVADPRFQSLGDLTFSNNALYVVDRGTGSTGTIYRVDLAAAAVPAPATTALAGTAGLAFAAFARLRRRLA